MPSLADIINAEQAQRRAQMTHVGQYDNETIRARRLSDLVRAPGRIAQGAFTGLAGAPVDIANMALQPIGLGSDRPVGGSNYLASLINAPTESTAYQAGTMLPIGPESLAIGGAKLAGLVGMMSRTNKNNIPQLISDMAEARRVYEAQRVARLAQPQQNTLANLATGAGALGAGTGLGYYGTEYLLGDRQ